MDICAEYRGGMSVAAFHAEPRDEQRRWRVYYDRKREKDAKLHAAQSGTTPPPPAAVAAAYAAQQRVAHPPGGAPKA